jgi:hypothetical protein
VPCARQSATYTQNRCEIDLGDDQSLAAEATTHHLAPRIDDYGLPVRSSSRRVTTDLRGRHDPSLVFDRSGA